MNTAYDMTESATLITKLLRLTRDNKIEWTQKTSIGLPEMGQYQTTIDGDLRSLVWSTNKAAGFRLSEKVPVPPVPARADVVVGVLGSIAKMAGPPERDLIAISIDHDDGSSRGELYVNLMSLLELARRSADKIEPKIERLKEYLDKLAV
ncbi:MAG: hypothetical protein ACRD3N_00895 [Terracidiphilus sp.]